MRVLWRIFSGLFIWTWRLINFVREFILNLFLLLLILVGVGIYLQVQGIRSAPAKQGALLVNLRGTIVDKPANNNKLQQLGLTLLGNGSSRLQENSLFDVVETLRQAKNDSNITGIVLLLNDFAGADQPSLQYIGKALREFRDKGKPIYAIGDSYNQSQYYLASFANKIYLTPQGNVTLQGIATNNLYFKSLLDTLKVSTHIFRVGTYKSAVEPFIRNDMSPEAKEADGRWVNGLWQNYLNTVAANRQLQPEQLFPGAATIINGLRAAEGDSAQYALKAKWVDEVATRTTIEQQLVKIFKEDKENGSFRAISIYDYSAPDEHHEAKGKEIAVLFANGAIMDGKQSQGVVGGDDLADQIRQARLDSNIRAIVLRVNSPGGSVTASELIRSELSAVRAAGKPVVVSMGGMAASGGYWISTPANYIIADPSTLTGSIGIFGIINTYENTLSTIGVNTDGVASSPLADLSMTKALPDEFSQMMQLNIENGYKNFVNIVAQSRKKTPEQVDSIAQGHVWLGLDAKTNGLVDQLGDFDDAVKKAAELANLNDWQLNWFVDGPNNILDYLFGQIGVSMQSLIPRVLQSWLPAPISTLASALQEQPGFVLTQLNDPQHRYVLCLACSTVR